MRLLQERFGFRWKCGKNVTQEAFKDQNICVTAASRSSQSIEMPFNQLVTSLYKWRLPACLPVWNQLWGRHLSSQNAVKYCIIDYMLGSAAPHFIHGSSDRGETFQKGAVYTVFVLSEVILRVVILLEIKINCCQKLKHFHWLHGFDLSCPWQNTCFPGKIWSTSHNRETCGVFRGLTGNRTVVSFRHFVIMERWCVWGVLWVTLAIESC